MILSKIREVSMFRIPATKVGKISHNKVGLVRMWERTKAKRKGVMGHERRCKVAFAVTKTKAERSGRMKSVYGRRSQANETEG